MSDKGSQQGDAPDVAKEESGNLALEKKDSQYDISTSPVHYNRAKSMFEDEMKDAKNSDAKEEKKPATVRIPKAKGGKYTYEELKMPGSALTKDHIDVTQRETYLSTEEFEKVFEMSEKDFYGMAKWKQADLKKAKKLF